MGVLAAPSQPATRAPSEASAPGPADLAAPGAPPPDLPSEGDTPEDPDMAAAQAALEAARASVARLTARAAAVRPPPSPRAPDPAARSRSTRGLSAPPAETTARSPRSDPLLDPYHRRRRDGPLSPMAPYRARSPPRALPPRGAPPPTRLARGSIGPPGPAAPAPGPARPVPTTRPVPRSPGESPAPAGTASGRSASSQAGSGVPHRAEDAPPYVHGLDWHPPSPRHQAPAPAHLPTPIGMRAGRARAGPPPPQGPPSLASTASVGHLRGRSPSARSAGSPAPAAPASRAPTGRAAARGLTPKGAPGYSPRVGPRAGVPPSMTPRGPAGGAGPLPASSTGARPSAAPAQRAAWLAANPDPASYGRGDPQAAGPPPPPTPSNWPPGRFLRDGSPATPSARRGGPQAYDSTD